MYLKRYLVSQLSSMCSARDVFRPVSAFSDLHEWKKCKFIKRGESSDESLLILQDGLMDPVQIVCIFCVDPGSVLFSTLVPPRDDAREIYTSVFPFAHQRASRVPVASVHPAVVVSRADHVVADRVVILLRSVFRFAFFVG